MELLTKDIRLLLPTDSKWPTASASKVATGISLAHWSTLAGADLAANGPIVGPILSNPFVRSVFTPLGVKTAADGETAQYRFFREVDIRSDATAGKILGWERELWFYLDVVFDANRPVVNPWNGSTYIGAKSMTITLASTISAKQGVGDDMNAAFLGGTLGGGGGPPVNGGAPIKFQPGTDTTYKGKVFILDMLDPSRILVESTCGTIAAANGYWEGIR